MPAASSNRDGFSIAEVILALLLLSFVILGFQAATGEIIRYAGTSDQQSTAVQLADARLDLIRLDPEYQRIAERYAGVEEGVDGKELDRTTEVARTLVRRERGELDYLTITVTVEGASLREPVSRTLVIGSP